MKPLTIEQLKSLKVGDCVWVVMLQDAYRPTDVPYGEYHRVVGSINPYYFMVSGSNEFNYYKLAYSDYGETWTAYKNKEMAESKGEIVELPCIREVKGLNYVRYNIYFIRTTAPDIGAIDFYTVKDKLEAERRLAELKK